MTETKYSVTIYKSYNHPINYVVDSEEKARKLVNGLWEKGKLGGFYYSPSIMNILNEYIPMF